MWAWSWSCGASKSIHTRQAELGKVPYPPAIACPCKPAHYAIGKLIRGRVGMLSVNVTSNYKKLSRSIDQLGRKQLPFAFAKTLNQSMKAVEKYTVARTYPRAFDVRNKSFFKASMFTGDAGSLGRTQSVTSPRRC